MIGDTLRYYRKVNNLSQKNLEQIIQITRQSISKWENDKCLPDIDNLILLAIIYECSVDQLVANKKKRLSYIIKKQESNHLDE